MTERQLCVSQFLGGRNGKGLFCFQSGHIWRNVPLRVTIAMQAAIETVNINDHLEADPAKTTLSFGASLPTTLP